MGGDTGSGPEVWLGRIIGGTGCWWDNSDGHRGCGSDGTTGSLLSPYTEVIKGEDVSSEILDIGSGALSLIAYFQGVDAGCVRIRVVWEGSCEGHGSGGSV